MHAFLMRPPSPLEVDHRDGDGLNNQRGNLRVCTHAQNMANRRAYGVSRYLGVSYTDRPSKPWTASCKGRHIGSFDREIEAALAYDLVAEQVHGPFARFNCPIISEAA